MLRPCCLAILLMGAACAGPLKLTAGSAVPGAQGDVRVGRGDNGNTRLVLDVRHLAPPGKVSEGAIVYVVWVQSPEHVTPPQNIGELKVSDDESGSLETLTPLAQFDLTVTPESSPQAVAQTGKPVLSVRVEPH